jgi:hypothetical protein
VVEGPVSLKSGYVRAARLLRVQARRTGLLSWMECSKLSWVRHARTMLSIYDAHDLAALDLPWWTYRAATHVEGFLASRNAPRVFEYGSGASTLWLSRRAAEVHTVEHDRGFAEQVRGLLGEVTNVTLHAVPGVAVPSPSIRSNRAGHEGLDFAAYVDSVALPGGHFDLVVIDGRARLACLARALDYLSPGGMVLFDDIRRARYRPALETPGIEYRLLRGAKPSLPYPDATALIRLAT